MKIVAKQKEMGVKYLDNRQTDIDASNINGVGTGGQREPKVTRKPV
jgi:hypothetical protein